MSTLRASLGTLIVLGLCGAVGCEVTAELGAYAPLASETTVIETESGSAIADTGDESGTAGGGETGDGDGDPGDGDGDPGDDLCMIQGSDDPCQTCLKFLCCDRLSACNAEFGCNCMVECLARNDPVTCATTCTPGSAYFLLLQCQATNCMGVCT